MLINHAVIADAVSETAIDSESDKQVVPSTKAKVSESCLGAAVEAVPQGAWHEI